MSEITHRDYTDEQGVKVREAEHTRYIVRSYRGSDVRFKKGEKAQAAQYAGGADSDGSGVFKKVVVVEQTRYPDEETKVSTTTVTTTTLRVKTFTPEGKKNHQDFIARQNCKHQSGTRVHSWGAGCTSDADVICNFCGAVVG